MQKSPSCKKYRPIQIGIICFKQEKGLKNYRNSVFKGHGYTLKTSIFAIFQKSAKKGVGVGHCPICSKSF